MRLFGKDLTSYTMLEQQADIAFRAATAYHALSVNFSGLAEYVSQVDEIEHEGDKVAQQFARKIDSSGGMSISKRDLHALSSQLDLNSPARDAILVIKWKEIYDTTELAIDKCEHATNIVQSILVKHA